MENNSCPFCLKKNILLKNNLCFVIWDKYPVNKGHSLIIPYRHISSYFDTTVDEKLSILDMIGDWKEFIEEKFHLDGYNIIINNGEAAGQTIMHFHIHMIPRYLGDSINPYNEVSKIIPLSLKH